MSDVTYPIVSISIHWPLQHECHVLAPALLSGTEAIDRYAMELRAVSGIVSDESAIAADGGPEQPASWEAEVLRRIAPRLAEVRRRTEADEVTLGWEAASVRCLTEMTREES